MAKFKRHLLLFLFIISAVWGCGRSSSKSPAANSSGQSLIIEPYKERCSETSEELCYLIRRGTDDSPRIYRGEFSGLQFEWGRRYTVAVERGPENTLRVVEVLNTAQESIEDAFLLQLSGNDLRVLENCTFAIANEVKFATAAPRLCRQLKTLAANGGEKLFEFTFTGSSVVPIRLESLGPANGEHRE